MKNPVEIILKKRNGEQITTEEMSIMVNGYISGKIPDYQMSSFLMAIYFQGMARKEIIDLTRIYIESGTQIEFPSEFKTVDKHSTGGVGDKITMVLAPIVAACGAYIPMISGRGLGHTGGTLDKLESIPGFNTYMTVDDFRAKTIKHNLVIVAQSESLVPADKKIYALRDVSGCVESLPLICASIMSKKLAEGAQNLVIDLKVGSGAFMKTQEEGKKLGELLKYTGESFGQKVSIVYTEMNSPIGYAIGNGIEIKESIEYLQGKVIDDVDRITKSLAIEMLLLSELATDKNDALTKIDNVIKNGKALEKFGELITIQGGDARVIHDTSLLPESDNVVEIISSKKGVIKHIDSQKIGYALIKIRAGRTTLDSKLDLGAGVYFYKKVGDEICVGEKIGKVHCENIEMGKIVADDILDSLIS